MNIKEDKQKHPVDDLENDDSDNESVASNNENLDVKNDDKQTVYKESSWPAKPETPKGFTFKGKSKMMTYAMEKTKATLKKGIEKEINYIKFKVLDAKTLGGATQVTVEMSDNEGRGNAIIDFWGPNKNKQCTILIKKSKEHDEKFVNILAKQIIQPILDCIISGKNLVNMFSNSGKKEETSNLRKKTMHVVFATKLSHL